MEKEQVKNSRFLRLTLSAILLANTEIIILLVKLSYAFVSLWEDFAYDVSQGDKTSKNIIYSFLIVVKCLKQNIKTTLYNLS